MPDFPELTTELSLTDDWTFNDVDKLITFDGEHCEVILC
jgi:hypothetical protein